VVTISAEAMFSPLLVKPKWVNHDFLVQPLSYPLAPK